MDAMETVDAAYFDRYDEVMRSCIKGIAEYFSISVNKNLEHYTREDVRDLTKKNCASYAILNLKQSLDGDRFAYEDRYYTLLGRALYPNDMLLPSAFCVDRFLRDKCLKQLEDFQNTHTSVLLHAYYNVNLKDFEKINSRLLGGTENDPLICVPAKKFAEEYLWHVFEKFEISDNFPEPFDFCEDLALEGGISLVNVTSDQELLNIVIHQ